jgi:DNA-binding winged helix-turn-helix (wHTH) protein
MKPRKIVRFGEFALDSDSRRLTLGNAELHLTPKAFELLLTLVEHRPKALSKSDLQSRLWPETFVTEANLTGLVKEIRSVLGDDPRTPRFIRTLHGFGYAFDAAADDGASGRRQDVTSGSTFWVVWEGQIRLSDGPNILGRDPEATVWFDRPGVSRLHARIVVDDPAATIEDLGSTNGTWVRGERISESTPLRDGDEIRLGPVTVTFRVRHIAASTEALS